MLTIDPSTPDNVVVGVANGKLTHEDYDNFRGHVEQMIHQHGSVRVMLDLTDSSGWEPRAAWDDLKMGLQHLGEFERCAILGDGGWKQWMTNLAKPLFRVSYFDRSEREAAWRWLMQPAAQVEQHGFVSTATEFVRHNPIASMLVAGGLAVLLLRRLRAAS